MDGCRLTSDYCQAVTSYKHHASDTRLITGFYFVFGRSREKKNSGYKINNGYNEYCELHFSEKFPGELYTPIPRRYVRAWPFVITLQTDII